MKVDDEGLHDDMLSKLGVFMTSLPPYNLELNSTEFCSNTLLMRLTNERARYICLPVEDFFDAIKPEMLKIILEDVKAF